MAEKHVNFDVLQHHRPHRTILCAVLCILFANVFLARSTFAVDSLGRLSQYGHSAWRVQDGIFGGAPSSVVQTKDGFLWIGTRSGLYRFDGAQFTPFMSPSGEQLRSPRITSLLAARDGSLWIGTGATIAHWHEGTLTQYPDIKGFSFGRIFHIVEDQEGVIWFVRGGPADDTGPLCRITDSVPRCYSKKDGILFDYSGGFLLVGEPGKLWINSDDQLFSWSQGSSHAIRSGLTGKDTLDAIESMAFDADGTLLVGMAQSSRGMGLARLVEDRLVPYSTPQLDGRALSVQNIFLDSQKALWIGTQNAGLYRVYKNRVEHYRSADGLSSDTVNAIFEDSEHNIWVATAGGIDRFRDLRVTTYSVHEGLGADTVANVVAAKDGTVWVGNWHSLDSIRNGLVTSMSHSNGLPGEEVTSLFEDSRERLWVGIDSGLTIYEHGKFTRVTRADGSATGPIGAMAETPNGDIWAMSEEKPLEIFRLANLKIVEEVTRNQLEFAISQAFATDLNGGFWIGMRNGNLGHWHDGHADIVDFHRIPHTANVYFLRVEQDGSVLGGTALGLIGSRNGDTRTMDARNGLPCPHIWSFQSDSIGTLWLYSECGLLGLAADQLAQWWSKPDSVLQFKQFDSFDGAQPAIGAFFPLAARSPDGRIWFANSTVLQTFDPLAKLPLSPAPATHIERLVADDQPYPLHTKLRLPPLTRSLQIDYTAPSFSIPQKVHFRYRLEGQDPGWVEAGTRRQAFYTDLAPGHYNFRVMASSSDGVWSESDVNVPFEIAPMFYQTRAFVVLCAAAMIVGIWLLLLLRLRQMRAAMRTKMKERLDERERIARDLHDTFFQGIQGLLLRFNTATSQIRHDDPAKVILSEALDQSDKVMLEGRELVLDLRSGHLETSDLARSLAQVGEEMRAVHSVPFSVSVTGKSRSLHPNVFNEVLRIGKEALSNAFRHSKANGIEVEVQFEVESLRVRVRDDGIGVASEILASGQRRDHFGLPGMRERASRIGGRLEIWSAEDKGTEVDLWVSGTIAYRDSPTRLTWRRIGIWLSGNDELYD
jgi:signal transduction histidine kinase/ligand-binding sensor domain-containing protein